MKALKFGAIALATVLGFVGTSAPAGPNAQPVERFGRVFAVSVCGRMQVALQARCFGKVITDASGNIINGKPDLTRNVTPSGYSPNDLNSAYGLSPAKGAPGTGPTIAIVDAYGYPNAEKDLNAYRAQYGLGACSSTGTNPCFRKVNQNGGTSYPRTDLGWSQEQALDLDMASAMCPNCKILLVQATTPSYGNLAAAVNRAAAMGAIVISNSYGGSESGSTSYETSYNHAGVAVTVSSGDYGYGVQFPASSPHVVAVGGTHLTRSGSGWTETVWDGAGSGCSSVYGILASTQSASQTGCPNRAVADVAAVADPNTGVAVYGPVTRSRSGWMVFGGTSVSAPLIGGIYASAGGIGTYPTTKLYSSAASAFRDIVSGSNGSCPTTQWCNGVAGWDGPTGRGTAQGTSAF